MTRQKSEGRVVAKGRGNTVPTHPVEPGAGAKGSPVNEEVKQLSLRLETAEESAARPSGRTRREAPGTTPGAPPF